LPALANKHQICSVHEASSSRQVRWNALFLTADNTADIADNAIAEGFYKHKSSRVQEQTKCTENCQHWQTSLKSL
jgi:hypothetical protein